MLFRSMTEVNVVWYHLGTDLVPQETFDFLGVPKITSKEIVNPNQNGVILHQ